MKKTLAYAVLGIGLTFGALAGCGDSSSGSGGSSSSTTSGSNCTSAHVCVNGACNCGSDGKGQSCTDDTKCVTECRTCT